MTEPAESNRPIRSYVIRSGRLTESQRKALDEHWHNYVIDYSPQKLQLNDHFPNPGPLTVEIGFGMGDSLLAMAEAQPEQNFLGIEVHRPGVGKLMHGINRLGLNNIKLMCHDATEVMANCFDAGSIDRIMVLFPDPWPKKRHNKRRIIQPEFATLLGTRLKKDGVLHLATDWQAYAEHMLEVLEDQSSLINANGAAQYWDNPLRPPTKFEKRGQRLGHGVWDLLYRRVE